MNIKVKEWWISKLEHWKEVIELKLYNLSPKIQYDPERCKQCGNMIYYTTDKPLMKNPYCLRARTYCDWVSRECECKMWDKKYRIVEDEKT
jgi:hypothetical protein